MLVSGQYLVSNGIFLEVHRSRSEGVCGGFYGLRFVTFRS